MSDEERRRRVVVITSAFRRMREIWVSAVAWVTRPFR